MVVTRFRLLIIVSLEKRNIFIISQKYIFLRKKYTESCALQHIYSRIRVYIPAHGDSFLTYVGIAPNIALPEDKRGLEAYLG